MTLVWSRPANGTPQTHALIIGVGKYNHLRNGTGPKVSDDMGLRQLTSPPSSARAFAEHLLARFEHDTAPLGSLEVLISDDAQTTVRLPDSSEVPVGPATIADIRQAFLDWYQRCDANSGNVAILYFCGHGVMVQGDSIILPEDFGANHLSPYESAINLDRMYRGMANCKAGLQCFFIDACSNVPVSGLRLEDAGAQSFVSASLTTSRQRLALLLKASAPGDSAYADGSREVSRFTQALILALDGLGSIRDGGKWVVFTTTLVEAVNRVVDRLNRKHGHPIQIPSTPDQVGRGRIAVRQAAPVIPVTLRLHPTEALNDAKLCLRSQKEPQRVVGCTPEPDGTVRQEWEVAVEAGRFYNLEGRWASGRYRELREVVAVMPDGCVPDPILAEAH